MSHDNMTSLNLFKVGDKVRCIGGLSFGNAKGIGEIIDVSLPDVLYGNKYSIVGGGFHEGARYRDEELELAKNEIVRDIIDDL